VCALAAPLQARWQGGDNIVLDLTDVDIPCTGTWQGQAWNSSKCGTPEIYGWQQWLLDYTNNVSTAQHCHAGWSCALGAYALVYPTLLQPHIMVGCMLQDLAAMGNAARCIIN
jgi:hypothetical protein